LSQFRLENYKMYEWFSSCRERFVENSVESVEIHPKKRRQRWTFARSPQSFQLVEKTGPFYNLYTGLLWKTSPPGNGTDILPGSWQHFFIPGRGVWGGSGKFSGRKNRNSMASPLMLYFKMNQYRILSQKQETFRCRKRLSIEIERRTTHGRKKYPAPSPP